ncbi:hypothetical protein PIROE2DRAFT_17761 [Piromyces sp. E2]|nr:hypothetical protein PIROE2DRAFT_17761 [Piromyces sp. E2]|eukprot:OUM57305.1 hypothetical protein PIROE2DRAFT_17761 [Piromyces sp. E2]
MLSSSFLNYFLSLYISFFIVINSTIIKNNEDFLKNINVQEELHIQDYILINDTNNININSSSISLIGDFHDSTLQFSNNISFLEKCEKIEIKNITIYGNLNFHNNKKIKFENVIFNGIFIINNDILESKSSLEILNSSFFLSNQKSGFEINHYNVNINNSNFYGNNIYNLYLLKFIGSEENINIIRINNSTISGNYFNSGIQTLSLSYTYNVFNYTKFINNYSESRGGSIFLYHTYDTSIYDITFKNTTAFEYGHALSIYSDMSYTTNTNIKNVKHYGNLYKNNFITEGTFLNSYGENLLTINNYEGSNISTGNVMSFEGDPKVTLSNFTINNIYLKNKGAVIKTYNPKKKGASIEFNSSYLNDIVQNYDLYTPMLLYILSGSIKINR